MNHVFGKASSFWFVGIKSFSFLNPLKVQAFTDGGTWCCYNFIRAVIPL